MTTTNPSPNIGDRIVAAFAAAGLNILKADQPKIQAAIDAMSSKLVVALVNVVEKDFPRASMEERMLEGPLLSLLQKAEPELTADLDAGGAAAIAAIETALANAQKAGG